MVGYENQRKKEYMITQRILYKCKKYLEERINILFDDNIDLYIKGAKNHTKNLRLFSIYYA